MPLIERRDELSITLNQLSKDLLAAREELNDVDGQNRIIARENVELATKMLALAEEANTRSKDSITDPKIRQELDDLEVEMKISRQRWRIMKGTASAAIAGSGIDWARDPKLLAIVLDNEE